MCPDLLHPGRSLDTLKDEELRRLEKSVTQTKEAYIPGFPQNVIKAIVDADAVAALPLVLAIHRQLVLTKRKETALNAAIWKCAGSPSPKRREAILRKLKAIPHVVGVFAARTATTRYRVTKGEEWPVG